MLCGTNRLAAQFGFVRLGYYRRLTASGFSPRGRATHNRTLRFAISDKRSVSVCSEENLLRPKRVAQGHLSAGKNVFLRQKSVSASPNHPPTTPTHNWPVTSLPLIFLQYWPVGCKVRGNLSERVFLLELDLVFAMDSIVNFRTFAEHLSYWS